MGIHISCKEDFRALEESINIAMSRQYVHWNSHLTHPLLLVSDWLHNGLVQLFQYSGMQEAADNGELSPVHQESIYMRLCLEKNTTIKDFHHPGHDLYCLLTLGRRYRCLNPTSPVQEQLLSNNYHVLETTCITLILPRQHNMRDNILYNHELVFQLRVYAFMPFFSWSPCRMYV